jgi:hypothetical protein
MRRACVFVDGENFRHTLKHLFPSGRYSFCKGDYLPETDWHAFFTSLADGFDCELLRVYWYVVEHVDCRPYKIPHEWDAKERVLARWCFDRINACSTEPDRHKLLKKLERELEEARVAIERRARGWREIHAGIESHDDQLEFRRSGSIPYELATKQFGVEKGVDTQLVARGAQARLDTYSIAGGQLRLHCASGCRGLALLPAGSNVKCPRRLRCRIYANAHPPCSNPYFLRLWYSLPFTSVVGGHVLVVDLDEQQRVIEKGEMSSP